MYLCWNEPIFTRTKKFQLHLDAIHMFSNSCVLAQEFDNITSTLKKKDFWLLCKSILTMFQLET